MKLTEVKIRVLPERRSVMTVGGKPVLIALALRPSGSAHLGVVAEEGIALLAEWRLEMN